MSRINIIFLVLFVGALGWVFLFGRDHVQRVQRGALKVFRPSITASGNLEKAVAEFGGEQLTATELKKKLVEMEADRDKLMLEVLNLDELVQENNSLRRALNYVEKSPLELVPAQVMGRKPSTWYNTIIINKGFQSGIEADSPVIVPVGDYAGLVGKVAEVAETTSIILLLTDEMCQVSARIEGTSEQGIASGQRGALHTLPDLNLKYLSKSAEMEEGRRVFSSGAGELFPANLLIGKIKNHKVGAIDAEAKLVPGVNLDKLGNVFIILPQHRNEGPPAEDKPVATPTVGPPGE